ncbi:hypothetical protein [Luteitalea sp.]|jgi:hypothetical protein|uniref:hypothetical protein n=1 Tax=Luteitalea sp. TaxID=2004800 RepID=UPI0037C9B0DE
MSRLGWNCPGCRKTYVVPDLVCEACGTVAGPLHVVLSTVERMGMMRQHFSLGPARQRPSREQLDASTTCPDCQGYGALPAVLLDPGPGCRRCAGTGYVWRTALTATELAVDDANRERRRAMERRVDLAVVMKPDSALEPPMPGALPGPSQDREES